MKELWLARHGETEWSLTGQHTGRTDLALTPNGEEQARTLGARISATHHKFAKVLSSPLQRALQTAHLAGFTQPEPCPDLMEWDYGDFEGRTTIDIQDEIENWSIWTGPVPQGESVQEVGRRAQAVIEACPDERVLLFAHGHILRVLAACWLRLAPTEGRLFALSTASLCVLGFEHDTPVIREWNLH